MRLGDEVEDYCSRCKRSMDHSIVSMSGEDVLKVRCRTCQYEHKFHKNKGGKKVMTKQEAFDKVLASVLGSQTQAQPPPAQSRKKGSK
jgi:ribosomal protein L44E